MGGTAFGWLAPAGHGADTGEIAFLDPHQTAQEMVAILQDQGTALIPAL